MKVLYHPHFEPNLSWLRSSLLVYDTVCSIVPTEASYRPSSSIKRHLDAMPGTFETVAPEPLEIVAEYFVLRALEQAFQRIAAESMALPSKGERFRFVSNPEGLFEDELEISGIVKLHEFKIAYSIYQMLQENALIYGHSDDGFAYVNEKAASLIVSFLAQRMSNRLAMRTITDGESFFYLSAACNVIEAGDPIDSRGVLASSVLRFHIPEDIGQISAEDYVELRKRYEVLREDFPLYLRDLGELIHIDDVKNIPDLVGRINNLVAKIDRDIARIKRSKIRASVKKWLPIGIGSAVTLGTAFVHDSPNLKFVTGATTVALQIVTEALHSKPLPARLEGTQSLLLSAQKDILHAKDMAKSLRITPQ
jgi:hypothetical protein